MIPIILLAAGSSSRMRGRDKLLEQVDGETLLLRQARIARSVSDHVLIALPPRPHPRYDVLSDLDANLVAVPDAAEGMGASIRTAIAALPDGTGKAMLLLADLPDITASDLQRVIDAVRTTPNARIWRGATQDGKAGHPIIFDQSLFGALKNLTGDNGGQHIVTSVAQDVHLVPLPGTRARLDLDTPEAWAEWHATRNAT